MGGEVTQSQNVVEEGGVKCWQLCEEGGREGGSEGGREEERKGE